MASNMSWLSPFWSFSLGLFEYPTAENNWIQLNNWTTGCNLLRKNKNLIERSVQHMTIRADTCV